MRVIQSKFDFAPDTEHHVIQIGSEPVLLDFVKQIDDLLISSPYGDLLLKWDQVEEWKDDECMLLQARDNMKEFGNIRCTKLLLKSRGEETVTVWITVQRN